MPRQGKYDTINVRPELDIKTSIDRLVEMLHKKTGFQITTGDAVNWAVKEAIKNLETKS